MAYENKTFWECFLTNRPTALESRSVAVMHHLSVLISQNVVSIFGNKSSQSDAYPKYPCQPLNSACRHQLPSCPKKIFRKTQLNKEETNWRAELERILINFRSLASTQEGSTFKYLPVNSTYSVLRGTTVFSWPLSWLSLKKYDTRYPSGSIYHRKRLFDCECVEGALERESRSSLCLGTGAHALTVFSNCSAVIQFSLPLY